MSRVYAKIQRSIWRHSGIRSLPEDARYLFFYLCTCAHGYDIGIFPLPDAYACDDLQWPQKRYDVARQALILANRAYWDLPLNLVCLPHSIKYNPPANPKVLVRWQLQFDALPPTALLAYPIKCARDTILDAWATPFIGYLDTLSIRYRYLIDTVSITVAPYSNPIPHTVTVTVTERPPTPLTPTPGSDPGPGGCSEVNPNETTMDTTGVPIPFSPPLDPDLAEVSKAYEDNICPLSPYSGAVLADALKIYKKAWIIESMEIAVQQNKRRWSYCKGILERWAAEGKDNGIKPTRNRVKGESNGSPPDPDRFIKGKYGHVVRR